MRDHLDTEMRTHGAGTLRSADAEAAVTLCGWIHRRRDHGGLVFFDLRDRYGLVQCTANPEQMTAEAFQTVESLRLEDVVQVSGTVTVRPAGSINPTMDTGEVEVELSSCRLLNESRTPPIPVDVEKDAGEVSEDLRLRYRFLDLRRESLTEALGKRHQIALETRRFLDSRGFWEIETPMLTRRTPEGARDYLVPSRIHPGAFYALPQSPQIYKQLLMIAGFDRYFQVVRCFRDEDLRADRQPEFTQIDLEMAFVGQEDVQQVVNGLFRHLFETCLGVELREIPVLTYAEAMSRYGTDKPDLRIPNELIDVTDLLKETGFRVFDDTTDHGGRIVTLRVPQAEDVSRGVLDRWAELATKAGAKGLVWARYGTEGWRSSADKFVASERWGPVGQAHDAEPGDVVLAVADTPRVAQAVLGELRLVLAEERDWVSEAEWKLLWVVDFPLFLEDDQGELTPSHHPFTAPQGGLSGLESEDPRGIVSKAYDLVLNGSELGSGSIRIHQRAVQERAFELLGISREEAEQKFSFLLEGLDFGAPPHGGIALGLDRIAMLFAGADSLREVIAFPKTTSASALLEGSPSVADEETLRELHIRVIPPESSS